jgi:organic hydroperoxide reductase OsmC/OhrA
MSDHHAAIRWARGDARFTDARYSRVHTWSFDGGAEIRASASPAHVPLPFSDPSAVDPEEAFIAALASCHMLVFLHLAAKRGLLVDAYTDAPVGTVTTSATGRQTLTRVVLSPQVGLASGVTVPDAEIAALHAEAHEGCFLAGAVSLELVVVPRPTK